MRTPTNTNIKTAQSTKPTKTLKIMETAKTTKNSKHTQPEKTTKDIKLARDTENKTSSKVLDSKESEVFSLFAKTPSQIATLLGLEKKFQGQQIYSWLVKGATSFDEMTNLSLALRKELALRYRSVFSSKIAGSQTDSQGNVKLALELFDGSIIECVLLVDKEGDLTACLSSQVGCAMGCKFCRTGTLHLKRNLYSFEIIEQFAYLSRMASNSFITQELSYTCQMEPYSSLKASSCTTSRTITHVVFMGMGEPLANLDNVADAISFLHDPTGYNISHRRITISTCGLVPGILELSRREIPVKLAVSLVTANDEKRSSLMPVNKAYNLARLREALERFQKVSGRRFTFEYCMIHNVNIFETDANELKKFCSGLEVIVNLIPFNPCNELEFETPTPEEIKTFTNALSKRNIPYTVRISRGRSIKGACGQLAGKLVEES